MGAVKIVADLSKPVQEGHFFNRYIIRSIGLTSFEKREKKFKMLKSAFWAKVEKFFRFFSKLVSRIDLIHFPL